MRLNVAVAGWISEDLKDALQRLVSPSHICWQRLSVGVAAQTQSSCDTVRSYVMSQPGHVPDALRTYCLSSARSISGRV